MEKSKILIADDSDYLRRMLAIALYAAGFEVVEAENGREAINKAKSEKPDLMLLDLSMPKVSGWQVCQEVRSNPEIQVLPIIIISAQGQKSDMERAKQYGAAAYLTKPFSEVTLINKIKEVLGALPCLTPFTC